MTRKDLKSGMLVKLRHGTVGIVLDTPLGLGIYQPGKHLILITCFNEDLTYHSSMKHLDIVRVALPERIGEFSSLTSAKTLWCRTVKVTKAEIIECLGVEDIEIIDEEE